LRTPAEQSRPMESLEPSVVGVRRERERMVAPVADGIDLFKGKRE